MQAQPRLRFLAVATLLLLALAVALPVPVGAQSNTQDLLTELRDLREELHRQAVDQELREGDQYLRELERERRDRDLEWELREPKQPYSGGPFMQGPVPAK